MTPPWHRPHQKISRRTDMRQITRSATLVGSVFLLGALAACAPQQPYPSQYPSQHPTQYPSGGYSSGGYQSNAPVYSNQPMGTEYGRVTNIEVLQGRTQGQTTGAGAVLGAVVGGVLGNQVGGGSGRTAATAVGADRPECSPRKNGNPPGRVGSRCDIPAPVHRRGCLAPCTRFLTRLHRVRLLLWQPLTRSLAPQVR